VNYFNRFGRTWQVYIEAEAIIEPTRRTSASSTFGTRPALQSTRCDFHIETSPSRIHGALQRISRGPNQRFGRTRLQLLPGDERLEETFRQTMPNEMGYDYLGLSFQKRSATGRIPTVVFGISLIFVFLILAALYESWSLPFSGLARHAVAVFGAFLTLCGAECKTTFTRRSVSSCSWSCRKKRDPDR
jgi:HAE1 family hydrophobic/amphiphilic exporter-1